MTVSNESTLEIFIGKGQYGEVFLIFDTNTDRLIARKKLINFPQAEKYIQREVNNFISLKNSYGFIQMLTHYQKDGVYIVDMDFIPSGSLTSMINNVNNVDIDGFDTTQEVIIAYGISYLMAKMHRLNKIHRDIKPDNILLDHRLYPYIGDFGFARDYSDTEFITHCGTRNYVAPEVINTHKNLCIQSDVYMLGMTMYEMVELKFPYQGLNEEIVKQKILMHELPLFTEDGKKHDLYPIILKCLEFDPLKRPSMEKVAQMLSELFDKDPNLDKDRFNEYVSFLKQMESKEKNEVPICGTIQNLTAAAQRGTPFAVGLLSRALNAHFDFKQDSKKVIKIVENNGQPDPDEEEEEYEPDL